MDSRLAAGLRALSEAEVNKPIHKAQAKALFRAYHDKWKDKPFTCLEAERAFHLPIINPDTGRATPTFNYAGKCDGRLLNTESDMTWLLEAKTCNEEIEDWTAPFWSRLALNKQVSGYWLSYLQRNADVVGAIYDVTRRLNTRPKTVPKTSTQMPTRTMVIDTQSYYGHELTDDEMNEWMDGDYVETDMMYSARAYNDIRENPDKHFQRREVFRQDMEVLEYASEQWQISHDLREAQKKGTWYRNDLACNSWGRPCEYRHVCCGDMEPDDISMVKLDHIHPELEGDIDASTAPRVLTHTRMRLFQLCRKRHYYRYELGIRPAVYDSDSLDFGRLWHTILEAWWLASQEEEDADSN